MRSASVMGVYAVEADQPCHLIELLICDRRSEFKVDDISQPVEQGYSQAAYDERFLDAETCQLLPHRMFETPDRERYRLAFFFHDLDLEKPLQSSFGPLRLPKPSARPDHLGFMRYSPP